jgi:ribosome recycling factor
MLKQVMAEAETKMKKSIATLKHHYTTVRSGKANAQMLDEIKVDYYGTPTPLKQVSSISTPEAQLIVVQPWEKTLIGEIVKAIQKSNLGLNPQSDGQVVRIPIPPLSEERRKELVKVVRKQAEENKVAIRNIRRDALDHLKKAEKDHKISEDERGNGEIEIQELTDKYISEADKAADDKEEEVMEV